MPVVSSQLESWARQGGTVAAKNAHESIRRALAAYHWPAAINYRVLLQGSYKNSTNIRGDSDVDVLVICTSSFFNNLTAEQKRQLGLTSSSLKFADYRRHVLASLTGYYGAERIDHSGAKSIKVGQSTGSPPADVVPVLEYRRYRSVSAGDFVQGVKLLNQHDGSSVVNFPEQHYDNGTRKSDDTSGSYKRMVRVYKNARNEVLRRHPQYASEDWSSYFIECALWNVPNHMFQGSLESSFYSILRWLPTLATRGDVLTCNQLTNLFGQDEQSWSPQSLKTLVSAIQRL